MCSAFIIRDTRYYNQKYLNAKNFLQKSQTTESRIALLSYLRVLIFSALILALQNSNKLFLTYVSREMDEITLCTSYAHYVSL